MRNALLLSLLFVAVMGVARAEECTYLLPVVQRPFITLQLDNLSPGFTIVKDAVFVFSDRVVVLQMNSTVPPMGVSVWTLFAGQGRGIVLEPNGFVLVRTQPSVTDAKQFLFYWTADGQPTEAKKLECK